MVAQLTTAMLIQVSIGLASLGLFITAVVSAIVETIKNSIQSFKGK